MHFTQARLIVLMYGLLLFLILAFYCQMYTARRAATATTTVSIASTTAFSPEFAQDITLSYSQEFADTLNAISTDDWLTYKSSYGYQIKYPPEWETFSCMEGRQVFFYNKEVPPACDVPHDDGYFSITGPVSPSEEHAQASPSRLTESFDLNGARAVRYIDEINGHSSDRIRIQLHGQFLNLYIGSGFYTTLQAERMLTTFQVDSI